MTRREPWTLVGETWENALPIVGTDHIAPIGVIYVRPANNSKNPEPMFGLRTAWGWKPKDAAVWEPAR